MSRKESACCLECGQVISSRNDIQDAVQRHMDDLHGKWAKK